MGAFSKLKNTKAASGAIRRFEEGVYRCKIDGVKYGESRKGDEYFAASFTIVEILKEDSKMKIGEGADWSAMATFDGYLGMIKDFVNKAMDSSDAEIDELSEEQFDEMMVAISGEAQIAAGRYIDVECSPYVNKKKEKTTVVKFRCVPEDEQPAELQAA